MKVETLLWPAEEERRSHLARAGVPRLLMVTGDEPPPSSTDCLEDWVRLPISEQDRSARIDAIASRSVEHQLAQRPVLDEDGLVWAGADWVAIPPIEARLLGVLIKHFGVLVRRADLQQAAWPAGAIEHNALNVRVLRLRRRLTPLGLVIRTVRARGYLLEWRTTHTSPSGRRLTTPPARSPARNKMEFDRSRGGNEAEILPAYLSQA